MNTSSVILLGSQAFSQFYTTQMCDYMLVVAKTNYFQIHNLTLDICLLSKRGITLVPLQLPGHFSVLVGYLSQYIYPRSQNFLNILIFTPLAPHTSNHNTRGGTLLILSRLQLVVISHSKKSDGNIIILKHGDFVSVSYPLLNNSFSMTPKII